MLIQKEVIKILGYWKIISDNCVFFDNKIIESASIIEFGNHGNKQICIKVVLETNREGGNRNIGFWKII